MKMKSSRRAFLGGLSAAAVAAPNVARSQKKYDDGRRTTQADHEVRAHDRREAQHPLAHATASIEGRAPNFIVKRNASSSVGSAGRAIGAGLELDTMRACTPEEFEHLQEHLAEIVLAMHEQTAEGFGRVRSDAPRFDRSLDTLVCERRQPSRRDRVEERHNAIVGWDVGRRLRTVGTVMISIPFL